MAEQTMSIRSDRYVNKSVSELQQANRSPIDGYENQEIMPLENAVEKIVPFVKDIVKYVDSAKQKCNRISGLLTWDESAAIYLYTMPITFYSCLNKTLRAENRSALKPWFAFLKLFMNGLQKLPSSKNTVWRAVAGDIGTFANENNETTWWAVNSTSIALNVVQVFLSETSILFAIDTIHGKNISEYSAFPEEQEVLLMPGTRVQVKSQSIHFIGYFSIIHLEEKLTVEQNPQSDTMAQLSISEPLLDNSSDTDLIAVDDSAPLVFNNPPTTRNPEKQHKIAVRNLIICATIIITIATTRLLISFLTEKQYSTSSATDKKSTKLTEYTTSVPSHGFTTTGNLSKLCIPNIPENATWSQNGITVAGGHGISSASNALAFPIGLIVDDDQTIVIADHINNRIVEWKMGHTNGQVVAAGNGNGNRSDQLNGPVTVVIDKETNSLIICDRDNRRVVQWSRRNGIKEGEILIDNIDCCGLAMDDQRYLYIVDQGKYEVRRYKMGDKNGTVVAGGNGKGNDTNQLDEPTFIFVDQNYSIYISDTINHHVMKWNKGATEGIIVAGGQGNGYALTQLHGPQGLFVDTLGTLYVAEQGNNRITRWPQGAKQGTVIAGGNGFASEANHLNKPVGLSFDRCGNLYVAEHFNHRVQRFSIE